MFERFVGEILEGDLPERKCLEDSARIRPPIHIKASSILSIQFNSRIQFSSSTGLEIGLTDTHIDIHIDILVNELHTTSSIAKCIIAVEPQAVMNFLLY